MKNVTVLIIGLSLFFYCHTGWCNGTTDNQTGVQSNTSGHNTLNVMSTAELDNLTTNWATEFGRLNPTIEIGLSKFRDNQSLAGSDLSFISDKNSEIINDRTIWKMVIGHDIIVPVINAKNPMMNQIYRQGISTEEFEQLFSNPEMRNWKTMLDGGQNAPINYYVIDNESAKSNLANFSKTNSAAIGGISVATSAELITAVQKDIYAIGFCKLTDVINLTSNELMGNIKLLPIDKNKNGRIDNFENIYDNLNAFTRGVWIGKYPRELSGNIYAVASSNPTGKNAMAFLTWVIADGQKFLNQSGYSYLASSEIQSGKIALAGTDVSLAQTVKPSVSQAWILILFALLISAFAITAVFMYFKSRKSTEPDEDTIFAPEFDENSLLAPKGLYFDKTHTWAFMEKDGMVKVGIDDFLQHITGKLTRVIMKEPGDMVRKGEKILTIIRNGKQLNIYAPISGTIKEQNKKLIEDTSIMNTSPYSDGWVYLIEPKNWLREIQFLFLGESYRDWLQDEFTRLKEFFAASVRSNTEVYAHIILQDGGELTDNVLADLEPVVWEDFQTKFIDTSK